MSKPKSSSSTPQDPALEVDAESLARGNEEIKADIQARFDKKQEAGSVVIMNLKENPMKVLGLAGLHSEAVITAAQMADPRFAAKIERARLLGLIAVK